MQLSIYLNFILNVLSEKKVFPLKFCHTVIFICKSSLTAPSGTHFFYLMFFEYLYLFGSTRSLLSHMGSLVVVFELSAMAEI